MGTNFYVKLERKDGTVNTVHIGKRSCGWKFLFKDNPDYYKPTRRDINRFLVLNKDNFYDEYGQLQDPGEFWRDTVDKFNAGFDYLSYLNYRKNSGELVLEWEWSRARTTEFYSDGLRFTSSDFA